jgi:pilus assembly protein CpaC
MHRLSSLALAVLAILSMVPASPRAADRGAVTMTARPVRTGGAVQIPPNGNPITLEINSGTLLRLPRAAGTVFVANPDIADVQIKSPELIYVSAKAPGQTVIYAVDAQDTVLLNSPIRVELSLSRLRSAIRQAAPGERVSVDSVDGNLVLTGAISDASRAEKVQKLATAIAGEAKGAQVINRMAVMTPNQVNLRVRIAEVDRQVLKQIGVDWSKLGGEVAFITNNGPTIASVPTPNLLRIGRMFGEAVNATVSALATEGFLTVLAEPNLTAVSGQTASFLAGGEFPYEVAQPGSVGNTAVFTIEFKQFGVQLGFTPTIIDSNRLSLRVRPEVSQLDFANGVPLNGSVVPALTVRRAETTVELASGESFALAGLLRNDTQQDISKVPWIGDIPILGALFRSNKFRHNESELVIIVTPYLVRPTGRMPATPVDGFGAPNDAQQVFFNDTYRQQLPGPARGPLNAGGKGLIGPAGFRLD